MKLLGKTKIGHTSFELAANTKHVLRVHAPAQEVRLVKLSFYVDGLGSGVGDQVLRAVIYTALEDLVAQGSEVIVRDGQAAGWVDLPFVEPGGVVLVPGSDYFVGVHAGDNTNTIRFYGDSF